MKRFLCVFFLCLLCLTGCRKIGQTNGGTPFVFYYPASGGGETLVEKTVYFPDGLPMLPELVQAYMESTPPEGATSAIPVGWIPIQPAELADGVLLLSFRGAEVPRIEGTLTAACLTHTFSAVDGVRSLCLTLPGWDEDLILSADDLLFTDTAMLPKQEQVVL